MKKLIASLMFFVGFSAQANLISFSVDETDVLVGETVEVTVIADMTDFFDTLGFQLEFDNTIFSYVAASFSSDFTPLTDGVFLANPESYGFGFSFVNFATVLPDTFTALTITLSALKAGSTDFLVTNAIAGVFDFNLFDIVPLNIAVDSTSAASTTVTEPVAVSEPATLGMFAALLIAGGMARRRRS